MYIPREVLATGQTGGRFDVDQQAVDEMEHGQSTPLRRFFWHESTSSTGCPDAGGQLPPGYLLFCPQAVRPLTSSCSISMARSCQLSCSGSNCPSTVPVRSLPGTTPRLEMGLGRTEGFPPLVLGC
jgi:hypothetical protein